MIVPVSDGSTERAKGRAQNALEEVWGLLGAVEIRAEEVQRRRQGVPLMAGRALVTKCDNVRTAYGLVVHSIRPIEALYRYLYTVTHYAMYKVRLRSTSSGPRDNTQYCLECVCCWSASSHVEA